MTVVSIFGMTIGWMNESPLIDKINPSTEAFINKQDKAILLMPLEMESTFFKIYYQHILLIKLVFIPVPY